MADGTSVTGLSLSQAKQVYDQKSFQELLDYVRTLEERVFTRNAHVEVYAPPGAGGRQPLFILRDTDGERWAVKVATDGTLFTEAVPSLV